MRRAAATVALAALAGLGIWLWQAQLPGAVSAIPARSVFTAQQIRRAMDYRDAQYVLVLIGLLIPPAVAWLLAWHGGDRLALGRAAAVRVATASFLVAAITMAVVVPIGYITHVRARNRGLDLQSGAGWLETAVITLLVSSLVVGVVYTAAWAIARRSDRPWLAVGIAAWVGVAVVTAAAAGAVGSAAALDPRAPPRACGCVGAPPGGTHGGASGLGHGRRGRFQDD